MISVDAAFLFLASVAFLGFILNALFEKLRIVYLLPLMLIGVLVGPILGFVNTASGSVIASLTPYITAGTVAIILFDVGLNINMSKLSKVLAKATYFTFGLGTVTGIAIGILAYFIFDWPLIVSFIFGFAVAGTTTIGTPAIVKLLHMPEELKTTLIYESITSDTYQLIVPSLLLTILVSGNVTIASAAWIIIANLLGSILFGTISALFWLLIMHRFAEYSKAYGWMLTITMIIATYGAADALGLSGLLTIFIFGVLFATIGAYTVGANESLASDIVKRYLFVGQEIENIKGYQMQIAFFTSAFFFVYIGMLVQIDGVNAITVLGALAACFVIVALRMFAVPRMLKDFMSKDAALFRKERLVSSFNIGRGITPAIVATLVLSYGLSIPGFVNAIFLLILFSNIIATICIFLLERRQSAATPPNTSNAAIAPAKPQMA